MAPTPPSFWGCVVTPPPIDPDRVTAAIARIQQNEQISINREPPIEFIVSRDLRFNRRELLPLHSNAMRFVAYDGDGNIIAGKTYYSIGGGFVVGETDDPHTVPSGSDPLPFRSAAELLSLCEARQMSIAELQLINELAHGSAEAFFASLDAIVVAMHACIDRGLRAEGELPGGLKVRHARIRFTNRCRRPRAAISIRRTARWNGSASLPLRSTKRTPPAAGW
jgi:L-serine dehydratase